MADGTRATIRTGTIRAVPLESQSHRSRTSPRRSLRVRVADVADRSRSMRAGRSDRRPARSIATPPLSSRGPGAGSIHSQPPGREVRRANRVHICIGRAPDELTDVKSEAPACSSAMGGSRVSERRSGRHESAEFLSWRTPQIQSEMNGNDVAFVGVHADVAHRRRLVSGPGGVHVEEPRFLLGAGVRTACGVSDGPQRVRRPGLHPVHCRPRYVQPEGRLRGGRLRSR